MNFFSNFIRKISLFKLVGTFTNNYLFSYRYNNVKFDTQYFCNYLNICFSFSLIAYSHTLLLLISQNCGSFICLQIIILWWFGFDLKTANSSLQKLYEDWYKSLVLRIFWVNRKISLLHLSTQADICKMKVQCWKC